MTVEAKNPDGTPIVRSGPYLGNGVTTTFDYDFPITTSAEVRVTRQNADLTEDTLELDVDYTVTGVGDATGGTVVLVDAADLPTGSKLILLLNMAFDQSTDYSNQGRIKLELLEQSLDRLTLITRQLREEAQRAVTVDAFATTDLATLRSNITALALIEAQITTVAANIADVNAVAAVTGDLSAVLAISADITAVAGIAAAVSTVASNIAAVNTTASNIAAIIAAPAEADAAAASAAAALASESAAAASAAAALASELAAAASAAALTKATVPQAEAGVSDAGYMTPLTTAAAIDAQVPSPVRRVLLVEDSSFGGTGATVLTYEALPAYPRYEIEFALASSSTGTRQLRMAVKWNGGFQSYFDITGTADWSANTEAGGAQGEATISAVNSRGALGGGIVQVAAAGLSGANGLQQVRAVRPTAADRGVASVVDGIRFTWAPSTTFSSATWQYVRIFGVEE